MVRRIGLITPGTRPELAQIEEKITAERGRISELYQVLLNSPAIAHGWETLLTAIRNKNSLPASLREMIILRVAVLNRADYEFAAHHPQGDEVKRDYIEVDTVADWQRVLNKWYAPA